MGAVLSAGLSLAAGVLAVAAPGVSGQAPGDGDRGTIQLAQAYQRDWNDKDWDRGREGRGRRAASDREQRAIEFIQNFFRHATGSSPDDYRFIASAFAPEVSYYGKTLSRESVLADKFNWIATWPVRDYRVQEDSAEWQCNENARLCVVRVLVDFDARNPRTGKVSKGVSTNEIGVRVTNSDVLIEYETSKVVKRR